MQGKSRNKLAIIKNSSFDILKRFIMYTLEIPITIKETLVAVYFKLFLDKILGEHFPLQ